MSFLEIVDRARSYLQKQQRISLRALRREFELDDDLLEELIEKLVDVQRVAVREGRVLVWAGAPAAGPVSSSVATTAATTGRDSRAYTPKHLAEKILQSKSAVEGERKQVTVLFADVKGSFVGITLSYSGKRPSINLDVNRVSPRSTRMWFVPISMVTSPSESNNFCNSRTPFRGTITCCATSTFLSSSTSHSARRWPSVATARNRLPSASSKRPFR